ncbi:MAG: LysE family translocator [Desulfobacteraceae bacterium]|nr:LysE family translocator [Desulfobacteraceae bacterium]
MTNNIIIFLIPITLLTLTPGVDTMLVIRNTTRGGWWDGATTSLGICSGLFFHAVISAIGISVLILQSALAFSLLKIVGAAYLFFLGAISLKSALKNDSGYANQIKTKPGNIFNARRSFTEGLFCNILNPKAIVFYMAFLPQFIDPSKPALLQTFFLAGLHFIIAMIWQVLLASMINRAKAVLEKNFIKKSLNAITGIVMMIFGAGLLIDN